MLSRDISYTEVRANLAETLNDVEENRSVVIIRRRNRPGIALIAEDELTNLMETVHLLRSPANARRLFEAMDRLEEEDSVTMPADEFEDYVEDLLGEQKTKDST